MSQKSRVEELLEYFKTHNKSKEQKAHASKVFNISNKYIKKIGRINDFYNCVSFNK